ncbi:unnamed protein product [Rotaria sp. Silwood2]|nr:unnamed protein product [Rotaria sp. Silwood2]CAF4378769.1 unnamed protein product [Rotaria sp. Silwood2]
MQSDVVYSIKCYYYGHICIGKTERQFIRRLYEHLVPETTLPQQQPCNHERDDLNNNNNNSNNITELRRSSWVKNKTTTTSTTVTTTFKTTADDDENDKNNAKSSIPQREKVTGHHMNWSNFCVVWQEKYSYRLLIKESLLIKAYEPELNKTTHSIPLIAFS